MKWICILTGALAMGASAETGQVAAVRDCPAPPGAINVALPSGVPPALRGVMGNIALPGEPFDTSDTRWIVATQEGGIAVHSAIFVYHLGKDGRTAALINKRVGFTKDVCGAATKLARR